MASAAGSRVRADPGNYTLPENVERYADPGTTDDGDAEDYDEQGLSESEDDDDSTASGPIGAFPFLEKFKLPQCSMVKRKLLQLKLLIESEYMDLCPHYQRNVVWRKPNMIKLIDSLWKRYYVPPVIFNVQVVQFEGREQPNFVRTCIDGKQRLTSIFKFMTGAFPIKINGKAWWFIDTKAGSRGKGKNVLSIEARREFESLELLCMEYKELSQSKEIELFQRVQEGKPLTAAESLKATVGPWQEFARLFEQDYADVMGCEYSKLQNIQTYANKGIVARQNDRASTFKMVLSCFSQIFECLSPTPSNGKPALKTGTKNVEQLTRMDLDEWSKEHCRFIFELFAALNVEDPSIFTDEVVTRVMSFSPLELVAVCCLLSRWGKERPQGMLSGDIVLLRKKLREAYHDLRLNATCWKTCWDYIDNLERYRGTTDQSAKSKARSSAAKTKQISQRKGSASASKPEGLSTSTAEAPMQVLNTTQMLPPQAEMMQPSMPAPSVNAQPAAFTSINGGNALPLAAHQPSADHHADDEDTQRQLILAQFQASKAFRASQSQNPMSNSNMQAQQAPAPMQVNGQQSVSATLGPSSRKRGGFDLESDPRMATRIKQESR